MAGPPEGQVRLRSTTPHDPIAGLCAYLLWLGSDAPDGWQERARHTLQFMLRLFLSGPLPNAEPSPTLAPPLSAAIAHLQREWSQMPLRRMGVAELAAAALVSRGHLNRLFGRAFGLTTAAALERLRCSRAETLLARTNLTIEAIAHQAGFADLSHFSHRFTAIHGISPRAYRAAGTQVPSVLDQPGVRRLSHLLWD